MTPTIETTDVEGPAVKEEPSAEVQTPTQTTIPCSKYEIRQQVWTHCEKNGLVSFPRPLRGRAPNFHGAADAAEKLAELAAFQEAVCVKVNTDKPQENVRMLVLDKGKRLIVSAPRVTEALATEVKLPEKAGQSELKKAASRSGMREWGTSIPLDSDLKIDLLVLGSVAVTRDGRRIGKGEGFGDLEFALLTELGVVTDKTVVVTTVHESQVFDTLPAELFKPHDFPVDVIVTPQEVIHVTERPPRPSGIIWNILSKRKMELLPVVKQLREKLMSEGREDLHLKEEDTDSETERTRRRLHQVCRFMRFTKRRPRRATEGEEKKEGGGDKAEDSKDVKKPTRKRLNRRSVAARKAEDGEVNAEGELGKKGLKQRRKKLAWSRIEFSLRVGNITSNVRVRDLKKALAECNVKPRDISWFGFRGYALLHFAKPREEPVQPVAVENIVASLRDMKLDNMADGVTLVVEPAKPLVRIETTDITAV